MTLSKIKAICYSSSNVGMGEIEYRIRDKYTDLLWWAWDNWSDEITKPFWGGDVKPAKPTCEFEEDFYSNMDFEEDFAEFLK
ncbi:MAG: hypothetical protein RR382_01860 [Tannerellaceae bacterium]